MIWPTYTAARFLGCGAEFSEKAAEFNNGEGCYRQNNERDHRHAPVHIEYHAEQDRHLKNIPNSLDQDVRYRLLQQADVGDYSRHQGACGHCVEKGQ